MADNINGADITPNDPDDKADNDFTLSDNKNATENSGTDNNGTAVNDDEKDSKSKNTGINNLIPFDKRTEEEQREICRKGGKASGEARRRKKDMREVARAILSHDMTEDQIREVLGTSQSLLDGDKSVMAVLTARMVQEAGKGNFKAYEVVRDTAGFKPKEEVGITADIMTDADRALIEKVSGRLGIKQKEI